MMCTMSTKYDDDNENDDDGVSLKLLESSIISITMMIMGDKVVLSPGLAERSSCADKSKEFTDFPLCPSSGRNTMLSSYAFCQHLGPLIVVFG